MILKSPLYLAIATLLLCFGCSSKKKADPESATPDPENQEVVADGLVVEDVTPDGPLPAFQFKSDSFDFGIITEGDIVEHVFEFENAGAAPLVISSATASCGCTVPEWPKEPIPVGERGSIKVQFNSSNKPGIQNKTVTVTANTDPKVNTLKIRAFVEASQDDQEKPSNSQLDS